MNNVYDKTPDNSRRREIFQWPRELHLFITSTLPAADETSLAFTSQGALASRAYQKEGFDVPII